VWGVPYHGSGDATALFIIESCAAPNLLDAIVQRRGAEVTLRRCVADALAWLLRRLSADPDGLLTYHRANPVGLENQCWRDSWDAVSHADGTIANTDQPVAALDAQCLAFDALIACAALGADGQLGDTSVGDIRMAATRLRAGVLDLFRAHDARGEFFAVAVDYDQAGHRRPVATRTSDMAALLDSGILAADEPGAREALDVTVEALLAPDLLVPAGLRSLSSTAPRFQAAGYHTGNVWLWQTLMAANGLDRHGMAAAARDLRSRALGVCNASGLLPEFARGDADRAVLNHRAVKVWQADDHRMNQVEQPPQQVQAWTAAGVYAVKRRRLLR